MSHSRARALDDFDRDARSLRAPPSHAALARYRRLRGFLRPKGTTTPAHLESAWTQRVITLDPKSRGIFIWTDTLRTRLPEMRDVRVGMVNLFLKSATGALTVNENCDPDVRTDMQNALEAIVPVGLDEERATLVGCSIDLPVRDGRLALGTWQGLYLLASNAGPVQVVATLVDHKGDTKTTKNVRLNAPSRGCHLVRDALPIADAPASTSRAMRSFVPRNAGPSSGMRRTLHVTTRPVPSQ